MAQPLRKTLTMVAAIIIALPAAPASAPKAPTAAVKTTTSDSKLSRKSVTPRWLERASRSQLRRIPLKWHRLAYCESRMRIHANRQNTYYGLWQIHKGWFKPFNIDPTHATIDQQYRVALHVYRQQGAHAWSCASKAHFR